MASQAPQLPLMYNQLEPLSNQAHAKFKMRPIESAPHLAKIHAIPLLIDEFVVAQRFYPIVFSLGDNPVPLALMGLNEGVNTFVDDQGNLIGPAYLPAYVRRYPFMLARATPDGDTLSLCFDPSSGFVGEFEEGQPMFDGDKPSEATQSVMKFCEEFEVSAQRTNQFMEELKKLEILMEGELAVQLNNDTQPNIYRGFKMIDEEKFRDMRGDELRRINQNGILPLLLAHLFSLPLARDIFLRQVDQGKGPQPVPVEAPAPAEA
jgi:hypothetical protein